MPKRKRDEISSSEVGSSNDGTTARALRLQRLQLDGLLDQGKKSLFRSLKVARGFERQKLGRRQKTAKADGGNATDTVVRLEAEVAALKGLDLAATAEMHLYRSLLKIKTVASAAALPHYVRAMVDGSRKPQEVASVNVQARLFRSGPVQVAMVEALKGIRAALGVEEVKSNSKKRLRAKDYANGNQANDMNRHVVSVKEGSSMPESRAQDEDQWSGLPAPESLGKRKDPSTRDDGDEDEDVNVNYDVYASRLAASSDEESVGEDVESQDHDRDKLDDMSITTEEEEEEEDPPEAEPPPSKTHTNNSPQNTHPPPKPKPPTSTSTTFLPSLSLAGYYSGTDSFSSSFSSSFSDDDNDKEIQGRKNRMGQQARRALWEKKFGENANHVRRREARRDEGCGGRKGARGGMVGGEGRGKRGRGRNDVGGRGGNAGRFAKSTGANSDPVGVRKKAAEEKGSLHPSWEAARKAKEQKKAVPFQGKKVVFD